MSKLRVATSVHIIVIACEILLCFFLYRSRIIIVHYYLNAMLRTGASRLALKTIPTPAARVAPIFRVTPTASQWNTQFSSMASKRPQISQLSQLKPIQAAVLRRALSEERKQAEAKYAKEEIKPTPETVSSTSSIHPFNGEVGGEPPHQEVDMSAGIKQDLVRPQAYHRHPASILTSSARRRSKIHST